MLGIPATFSSSPMNASVHPSKKGKLEYRHEKGLLAPKKSGAREPFRGKFQIQKTASHAAHVCLFSFLLLMNASIHPSKKGKLEYRHEKGLLAPK
jgi:hypothetical protein